MRKTSIICDFFGGILHEFPRYFCASSYGQKAMAKTTQRPVNHKSHTQYTDAEAFFWRGWKQKHWVFTKIYKFKLTVWHLAFFSRSRWSKQRSRCLWHLSPGGRPRASSMTCTRQVTAFKSVMSYLSYKNWFARNLQEKRWDWILSLCTSSNCCFQFQSKICTQNFGCLFSLFFSGIVFKLNPLKSTFDPQIPWFQLWIYRIDFTQLGSVLIKKLYLTISNWNFVLHLTISGFSPSAFQRKNIHILHWKWPIWGSLRFFPSGSGGIKESHQKLRINFHKFTKQQKHTHAIPMPLSPWRWGKVSFSHPTSWRVEAWLLWSQKTSPQIGSAARMTTSPWRKCSVFLDPLDRLLFCYWGKKAASIYRWDSHPFWKHHQRSRKWCSRCWFQAHQPDTPSGILFGMVCGQRFQDGKTVYASGGQMNWWHPNMGVSSNKLSFFKLQKPDNYQLRTLILGTVIHQQTEISWKESDFGVFGLGVDHIFCEAITGHYVNKLNFNSPEFVRSDRTVHSSHLKVWPDMASEWFLVQPLQETWTVKTRTLNPRHQHPTETGNGSKQISAPREKCALRWASKMPAWHIRGANENSRPTQEMLRKSSDTEEF